MESVSSEPTCPVIRLTGRFAIPALLASALIAPALAEPPPATLTLYHAFPTARVAEWAEVTLSDDPAAWRVNGPAGPAANRAQVEAVLASLKWLVIGSTCPSVNAGATHYPCGIEVSAPGRADLPGALRMDHPWASTTGDLLRRFDSAGAPASLTAFSNAPTSVAANAAGLTPMLAVDPSFIGFYTEDALADRTATLSFRFRIDRSLTHSPDSSIPTGLVILGTSEPAWASARRRARPAAGSAT